MNTDRIDTELERWKPVVKKTTLLLLAGVMWIGVGLMLDTLSYLWLKQEAAHQALLMAFLGFLCALVIHHFGFLRIVNRNLGRILPMSGKRCVFSFIPWQSYILTVLMVLMGILLRHSPIPKLYLAVLYIGIGTALVLSSIRYLRYLVYEARNG